MILLLYLCFFFFPEIPTWHLESEFAQYKTQMLVLTQWPLKIVILFRGCNYHMNVVNVHEVSYELGL